MRDVALALADDDPSVLLTVVSSMMAALDPRARNPFDTAQPDGPSREEVVQFFFRAEVTETSALLAVIAELNGDDVMRRRVRREVATRGHVLPRWPVDLGGAEAIDRVVEMVHVLGDGDNTMVAVLLPGGPEFSVVV